MIFHLRPFLKADLGNGLRLQEKEDGRSKDLVQERIFPQNIVLHIRNRIPALPEIFRRRHITKTTTALLYPGNTTITILKMMQADQIFVNVRLHMILYPDIVVEMVGLLPGKISFPF